MRLYGYFGILLFILGVSLIIFDSLSGISAIRLAGPLVIAAALIVFYCACSKQHRMNNASGVNIEPVATIHLQSNAGIREQHNNASVDVPQRSNFVSPRYSCNPPSYSVVVGYHPQRGSMYFFSLFDI